MQRIAQRISCLLRSHCSNKCLVNTVRLSSSAAVPPSTSTASKEETGERVWIKGVEEPEYLDYLKPQVPFYDVLNIKVKGYDYVVLDEYAKHIKKVCHRLRIRVSDSWPVPQKSYKIETLLPHSTAVENVYHLKVYERVVQVEHLKAIMAPILIEVLQASKPIGVTFTLTEHTPDDTERRYIPDLKLQELEAELEEWKQPMDELEKQHK